MYSTSGFAQRRRATSLIACTATALLQLAPGALAENEDDRLRKFITKYDTIVIGTIRSVEINPGSLRHANRFVITAIKDEVLQGDPLPKEIAIYIHSPSQEFPGSERSALPGKRCVWALLRSADKTLQSSAVFPFQEFSDLDLIRLRRLILEAKVKGSNSVIGTESESIKIVAPRSLRTAHP